MHWKVRLRGLAVFQDSGWYQANLSQADVLVKGVHWGRWAGLDFDLAKGLHGLMHTGMYTVDSTNSTNNLRSGKSRLSIQPKLPSIDSLSDSMTQ